MFISASRRTDIPAYYSQWFFRRMQEGYALVRNPMAPHQVSRVALTPDVVDGIVFWTKDPTPMLGELGQLRGMMYYFQFTLNAYGPDAEPGVPCKGRTVIPAFQRLAGLLGPERVIWRYDPIFLGGRYTAAWHIHYFEQLARRLAPYTRRCIISFLDMYRHLRGPAAALPLQSPSPGQQAQLARALAQIAHSYGLQIDACAENAGLQKYGIGQARCLDAGLFQQLLGRPLEAGKAKGQRPGCGCAESVDIGAYDSCPAGCRYCYANHTARAGAARHDPASPLLLGALGPGDRVTQRQQRSCDQGQLALYL